jgi:transposase
LADAEAARRRRADLAVTDAALEAQLFTSVGKKQGHRRRAEPDWAAVHRELKRKHVTLQILLDEYIERQSAYRRWLDGMCSGTVVCR